jgi:SAM-dependent methyltransferase
MEVIDCIFCEKPNYEIAIEDNGYTGRRCAQCGLVYISPRPLLGELVDLYGHDRSVISADQHIASSHIKRMYARNALRILRKYVACGSLLEIGAGAGYFLDEAREAGFEVHGLELNSLLATFMRNHLKIPCEESTLDASPFDGKKFDVICHYDVLSHFTTQLPILLRCAKDSREKGIMAFETGNFADVQKRFYRFIDSFLYPEHLFFFGERSLLGCSGELVSELIVTYRHPSHLLLME